MSLCCNQSLILTENALSACGLSRGVGVSAELSPLGAHILVWECDTVIYNKKYKLGFLQFWTELLKPLEFPK